MSELIDSKGSRRSFADEIGIPPTTLQSILSRGIGKASIDNVIKVCKALGITVEELEDMASGKNSSEYLNRLLTSEEVSLVTKYQKLDEKGKHTINTLLEMEYKRVEKSRFEVIAAQSDDYSPEQVKLMKKDLDELDKM